MLCRFDVPKVVSVPFVAVLLATVLQMNALADLVIVVGNGTGQSNPILVNAGSTATVPVYAKITTTGTTVTSQTLGGYDIALEFNSDNKSIPVGFTNFIGDASTGDFSNGGLFSFVPNPSGIPITNYDFIASDINNAGVTITAGGPSIKLFDLSFAVGSNVSSGIYNVNFILTAIPTVNDFYNTSGGSLGLTYAAANGAISVSAVPEPSSMLFGSLAAAGAISGWRRRKGKKLAASEAV